MNNSFTSIALASPIVFNVSIFCSNVPYAGSDKASFFLSLELAVRSILHLSQAWNITIMKIQARTLRIIPTSNQELCILFSSVSANTSEAISIEDKAKTSSFIHSLNELGFKISMDPFEIGDESLQNTTNSSYWNSAAEEYQSTGKISSAVVIAVTTSICTVAFCAFVSIIWFQKTRRTVSNKFINIEVPKSTLKQFRENMRSDEKRFDASDNCIQKESLIENPYSTELEEIIQLLARTEVQISSFFDIDARRVLEEATDQSTDLDENDRAAILQLISKIEIESSLYSFLSDDRKQQLQERISKGPFTENHSLVLNLILDNELSNGGSNSMKIMPSEMDGSTVVCTDLDSLSSSNEYLDDILQLLKNFGLETRFFLHAEGRKIIEESVLKQTVPLNEESVCLLQLLGMLEVDSGLPLDNERETLLQTRIQDGRLKPEHLGELKILLQSAEQQDYSPTDTSKDIRIMQSAASIQKRHNGFSQSQSRMMDSEMGIESTIQKQGSLNSKICIADTDLLALSPSEYQSDNMGNISKSIEVDSKFRTSILCREDKQALKILELKAKTARISRSLPEWVRKGLLPPPQNKLASIATSGPRYDSSPEWLRNFDMLLRPPKGMSTISEEISPEGEKRGNQPAQYKSDSTVPKKISPELESSEDLALQPNQPASTANRDPAVPNKTNHEPMIVRVNVKVDLIFPEEPNQELCVFPARWEADDIMEENVQSVTDALPNGICELVFNHIRNCIAALLSFWCIARRQ